MRWIWRDCKTYGLFHEANSIMLKKEGRYDEAAESFHILAEEFIELYKRIDGKSISS